MGLISQQLGGLTLPAPTQPYPPGDVSIWETTFGGKIDRVMDWGFNFRKGVILDTAKASIRLQLEDLYYDGTFDLAEFILDFNSNSGTPRRYFAMSVDRAAPDIFAQWMLAFAPDNTNGKINFNRADTGATLYSFGFNGIGLFPTALQFSGNNAYLQPIGSGGLTIVAGTSSYIFATNSGILNIPLVLQFASNNAYMQVLGSGGLSIVAGSSTYLFYTNAGALNVPTKFMVNSVDVVGARNTGWTAMVGTPIKGGAHDTATVTLPQLAGVVMALQAALTTHGLIGT